ncbi:MAG: hypothetical protein KGO94_07800 [Alphaproteobacteria bacterium]|nr:hypothetical protein [Alphaproteobacteria bacterium]
MSHSLPPKPKLSHQPWFGYSKHDRPRDVALPVCPSPRCRRAKVCLAATDNLYCLRTHHTPEEIKALEAASDLHKALDKVPELIDPMDAEERTERMISIVKIRKGWENDMKARWRAGGFDARYGKYRACGVWLVPPEKTYHEER